VALVETDVTEEMMASIIKFETLDELETAVAVNNNRSTLRGNIQFS
jgi:hypothetical protein